MSDPIDTSRPVTPADDPAAGANAASSDALTPAALQRFLRTAVLGHRIFYYPNIGSTNDCALELATAGEPEGALVLAEEQTAGRGRRDRVWFSQARRGIYASLILRPSIPVTRAPLLTFMAAVSAADTLRELIGLKARIKWPNDVLVGRRKIAGVLGEVRGSGPEAREVVIGLGINVNQTPEEFLADISAAATSVRIETGSMADRAPILAALLGGFERRYARLLRDGPGTLLAEWEALSALPHGSRVIVNGPAGRTEGTTAGVDEEGALRLKDRAGHMVRVPFGEIIQALDL